MAMKTLWMIILGMILFNGFLISFNVFFTTQNSQTEGLYDVTDIAHNGTFDAYKKPGDAFNFDVASISFVGIGGFLLTFVATFFTKDLKYLAAGALGTLVSTMWTASSGVFLNMMNSLGNPVLSGIITAVSIAIGFCVALLILGIFTSQEQLT